MRKFLYILGSVVLFFGLIFIVLFCCNSDKLDVDIYTYQSQEIDNLKICHLSDIHNHLPDYSNHNILSVIKDEGPDVVFITGDMIDKKTDKMDNIKDIFEALKDYPVFFVNGNHEQDAYHTDDFYETMNLYPNICKLVDEKIVFSINGTNINIIGLNDPSFVNDESFLFKNEGNAKEVLDELTKDLEGMTILLAHRPELFSLYSSYDIDLVFSGHTHGGQIQFPLIGCLATVNQGLFPTYSDGVYEKNETVMYLSRGLGNSFIDMRVNCNNQIIFVDIAED